MIALATKLTDVLPHETQQRGLSYPVRSMDRQAPRRLSRNGASDRVDERAGFAMRSRVPSGPGVGSGPKIAGERPFAV